MGPARAFSLARTCPPKPWRRREARRQFRSKKVRISSNKRTSKEFASDLVSPRFARRPIYIEFWAKKSVGDFARGKEKNLII